MTFKPQPASNFPAVSLKTGTFTTGWQQWFAQFSNPPSGISGVTVGPSPFRFVSSGSGYVAVSGGTVSSITLTRGQVSTPVGFTSGLVPVVNNDAVTLTYSVTPTINFIPS